MQNNKSKTANRLTPQLLRTIRKEILEATQLQIAEMVGISCSYWRQLESGSYHITAEMEVRIKAALGLTPSKLRHIRQQVEDPLGDE